MNPLGLDFSTLGGLDGTLTEGRALLVESLARRLRTRRGALFYDPSYGSYLPDYLGESFADGGAEAAALCELDLEEDPRVLTANVTVLEATLERISLQASLETNLGPLTLIVDALGMAGLYADQLTVLPEGVG